MGNSESDTESIPYEEDEDLKGFIVQEDVKEKEEDEESEDEQHDRLREITSTLKPNETPAQRILKAHISVLVSALGGPDHSSNISPAPYKLGLDGLACLKDLKRWIRNVDERNNSFDVALACADTGLVENDLIVILCQWENDLKKQKDLAKYRSMERIMLSCLELLVLLTWPVSMHSDMSEAQKLNFDKVRKAQVVYKKCILSYMKGKTLKSVIRLALPVIAKDKGEREPRDNAILRLVLFFIRNVLSIEPPTSTISTKSRKQVIGLDNTPSSVTLDDISMNTVLPSFKDNKVFMFLLTVTASLGTEFDKESLSQICLECIYLIIRNVDVKTLLDMHFDLHKIPSSHLTKTPNASAHDSTSTLSSMTDFNLDQLFKEENRRKKIQNQNISSRHARFGTLLTIHGNDTSYVISGQDALLNTSKSLERLDSSKKWNAKSHFKYDSDRFVRSKTDSLNGLSVLLLMEFILQFLVGGCFNKLIECSGWVLSGSSDFSFVDDVEKASYFLTLAWFFEFKRERTERVKRKNLSIPEDDDNLDYGSVSAGLSEVSFILIISYFRESFSNRNWNALHVAMLCFKELLLISNSIFRRKRGKKGDDNRVDLEQEEIDEDLAQGIIRKLFSFNDFLNIVVQIPQSASKHSPQYLNVCVSVVHILLKSFESFANENIKLYVQSKKSKKKKSHSTLDKSTENSLRDIIDESDEEMQERKVKEVSRERKLDFEKTEFRFFHTATVSTYIEYLSRFENLTHEEIKRCLSYFHRLFAVRKDYTGLYRIDFMVTLFKLRSALPNGSSIKQHADDFIYYFMNKFKRAFERFPNPIEILFPRFEDTEFKVYLATGELHERIEKDRAHGTPKIAKEIEFIRNTFTMDDKFKILVTALHNEEKHNFLKKVVGQIREFAEERLISPLKVFFLHLSQNEKRWTINSSIVRLFLSLVGFHLPLSLDEQIILLILMANSDLIESIELIQRWISLQPVVFEDEKDASFYLRSKETEENDDDYITLNPDNDSEGESIAFTTRPNPNGTRRNINELDDLERLEDLLEEQNTKLSRRLVKNLRKKDRDTRLRSEKGREHKKPKADFGVDDITVKSKSSEYVNLSDDESDEERMAEFFEREEKLRQLLDECGGILNTEQLHEFQIAWTQMKPLKADLRHTHPVYDKPSQSPPEEQSPLDSNDSSTRVYQHSDEMPQTPKPFDETMTSDDYFGRNMTNSTTPGRKRSRDSLASPKGNSSLLHNNDYDDNDENEDIEPSMNIKIRRKKKRIIVDE